MIAMKKYLIKGALALFAGAFLFSCAEKESEYVPLAQQKTKAFEEVFKEVYGDNIDPYQKWGFSDKVHVLDFLRQQAPDLYFSNGIKQRYVSFMYRSLPYPYLCIRYLYAIIFEDKIYPFYAHRLRRPFK